MARRTDWFWFLCSSHETAFEFVIILFKLLDRLLNSFSLVLLLFFGECAKVLTSALWHGALF